MATNMVGWVRRLPVLLTAAGLLILPACSDSPSYRYRMTVEVETPEGLRNGSSVIEVTHSEGPGLPGPEAASLQAQVKGEAVAVDLPSGRTLFALLRRAGDEDAAAKYALEAYQPRLADVDDTNWRERIRALQQQKGGAILPPSSFPMFVWFKDPHDPTTVEEVARGSSAMPPPAQVHVRRIVIEITSDPVTNEIVRRFPWWSQYQHTQLDGVRIHNSNSLANQLNSSSFKR